VRLKPLEELFRAKVIHLLVEEKLLPPELVVRRPGISPPPALKLPSKRWRNA
jgi:hypothetical protein